MIKNCGIYKITSPSGRVYIGQSKNIKSRWGSYKRVDKRTQKQTKLYKSLLKYGVENHQFDIIEYCSEDELNCSERFWQDEFDVLNGGLNCVLQECGELRYTISIETRKAISKANLGKTISDKTRIKMSMSKKGVLKSEETKKRMSERQKGELNHFYGKTLSDEHKQKIALTVTGKRHSEESKKKMSPSKIGANNVTSKTVLNTQTGIFYDCIREASEAHNIKYSRLRNILAPSSKLTNKTDLIIV